MKFTKEKYVEKPATVSPPILPGLGTANDVEALTQRFIFPVAAAGQHLSTLRNLGELFIAETPQEHRADFEVLAPRIVSKIMKRTYEGERLAPSLYEYASGREYADSRSILIALHGASRGNKILEVGYRSTRLDPHGKQVLKPRVYLGTVKELDDESVLLDTAYGLRRLRIRNLAWAVIPAAQNPKLAGVDLRVTGTKESPTFSIHILQLDEILKDEPREVFIGETEPSEGSSSVGGLRKIPINNTAVRLMLPYFGKSVYFEAYNGDGKQWFTGFSELKTAHWSTNNGEPKLTLLDERHERIITCTKGYILMGLPEELPENRL